MIRIPLRSSKLQGDTLLSIHTRWFSKLPPFAPKGKQEENSHVQAKPHNDETNHGHLGGVDGAKHQFVHRMQEKVGLKLVEKTVHSNMPRLAASRLLKRAGKKLGFRLIGRLGRGFIIAIPALGGIFASVIAYYDYRRTFKELEKKRVAVGFSFLVATIFDVVDAMAHVHIALGIGGLLEHSHLSENLSIFSAITATTAAIVGELMILRYAKEIQHDHDKLLSKVMIASSTGGVNSRLVELSSKQAIPHKTTEAKEEREPTPPTCW